MTPIRLELDGEYVVLVEEDDDGNRDSTRLGHVVWTSTEERIPPELFDDFAAIRDGYFESTRGPRYSDSVRATYFAGLGDPRGW